MDIGKETKRTPKEYTSISEFRQALVEHGIKHFRVTTLTPASALPPVFRSSRQQPALPTFMISAAIFNEGDETGIKECFLCTITAQTSSDIPRIYEALDRMEVLDGMSYKKGLFYRDMYKSLPPFTTPPPPTHTPKDVVKMLDGNAESGVIIDISQRFTETTPA